MTRDSLLPVSAGTPLRTWPARQTERKKLVSGVYYYIVTAKNGSQKFSGALTIIY